MGGADDPLLARAAAHHAAARTVPAVNSSAFLLSTASHHCPFSRVAQAPKSKMVKYIQSSSSLAYDRPRGEREATRVFSVQFPDQPTVAVADTIQATSEYNALPGQVPLVDHLAAAVAQASDWAEVAPHVETLRQSRIPTVQDASNVTELTLGSSPVKDWVDTASAIREAARSDSQSLFPFWAADTESTSLAVTWPLLPGHSTLDSLLFYISMEAASGVQKLEFMIAKMGQTGCGLPTRFFFGNATWQVHIRLPITYFYVKGDVRVVLNLDTSISDEAKRLFLSLGPTIGVGVTDDYVDWSKTLFAIWGTRFFENMAKPVELEHLQRLARINTLNSSIFHLNWWCFGTVLPKGLSSVGDGKWGMPLKNLPTSLQRYLAGDIVQTVRIASLLLLFWAIQSFPDMTVVRSASRFTAATFVQWLAKRFIHKLMAGWVRIKTESDGRWSKVEAQAVWVEQSTLEDLVDRLNPPSLQEFSLLWLPADWPSITCGGPRFLHEVRARFVDQLPLLRKLDPDSWVIHHEDKLLLWRFGIPKSTAATVRSVPVHRPGLVANPGLETSLPANPAEWTKAHLKDHSIINTRGDRAIICEFVRLNPGKAVDVLSFMETQKGKFRQLVTEKRMVKIVVDVRQLLEYLNIAVARPSGWVDPYNIESVIQKAVQKSVNHLKVKLEHFMLRQDYFADRIVSAKRALESVDEELVITRLDETSDIRTAVATTGLRAPIRKYRIVEKLGTAKDQLKPVRTVVYRSEEEIDVSVRASTPITIAVEPAAYQIPDVAPDMVHVIQQALNTKDEEVINADSEVRITGKDIKRLLGIRWLNDSVISAYLQLIAVRGGRNGLPSVFAFHTFFYPLLSSHGYLSVKGCTRAVDLFSFDLVLVPVHLGNHWVLVVVDIKRSSITYLDSSPDFSPGDQSIQILLSYLEKEFAVRKGGKLSTHFSIGQPRDIPLQSNGCDCGVFLCCFAEFISREAAFNFTQGDMTNYRQLMIWEISTNQLLSTLSPSLDESLIMGIDRIEMEDFGPL